MACSGAFALFPLPVPPPSRPSLGFSPTRERDFHRGDSTAALLSSSSVLNLAPNWPDRCGALQLARPAVLVEIDRADKSTPGGFSGKSFVVDRIDDKRAGRYGKSGSSKAIEMVEHEAFGG